MRRKSNVPAMVFAALGGTLLSLGGGVLMASYATAGVLPTYAARSEPPRIADHWDTPSPVSLVFDDKGQVQASGSSRL